MDVRSKSSRLFAFAGCGVWGVLVWIKSGDIQSGLAAFGIFMTIFALAYHVELSTIEKELELKKSHVEGLEEILAHYRD